MALAICLLLDPRSDRAVRGLWQRLESGGVSTLLTHTHGHHVPHLSYAVLRTFDVDAVLAATAALPDKGPMPLHFDTVGHFRRGRAAIVPALTAELAQRQARVVTAAEATGAELHHYYRPGWWVPHVSIATKVPGDRLAWATTTVHDVLPLEATAVGVALIDSSTGRRWPLEALA